MTITSSCTQALSRNVRPIAHILDTPYPKIGGAYTCRRRNVCTGLFHFLENSSQEVEFHLSVAFELRCLDQNDIKEYALW
jgi:hypothetical protein